MSNALARVRGWPIIGQPAMLVRPLLVGMLSGMGTFVYTRPLVAPWGKPVIGLVFLAAAGIYAHLLSETMWESVRVALGGAIVGIAVTLIGFAAPLWVLPVESPTQSLLFVSYLQQSMATVVVVYPLVYLAAYFVAVSADGLTT